MAPCSAARACSSRALPRASAALVIGSSRNPGHRQRLKEYGADLAIDNGDARWVDQVLQATGGKGVDLVIDRFRKYLQRHAKSDRHSRTSISTCMRCAASSTSASPFALAA